MTTLILIRHGESEANRRGIFAGNLDPQLQDRGLKQAQITAKYIADSFNVDKIYASDLKRAYKTAEPLARILGLKIQKEKNLREIHAGRWEGLKFSELALLYSKEYDMWLNHIGKSVCTEGESVKQLGERVMNTLTRIAEENDGKTVAVATHATPIRVMQSLIETGGLDEMENIPWVSNASVTVLEYENGKWNISAVSKDTHLTEYKTVLPANV